MKDSLAECLSKIDAKAKIILTASENIFKKACQGFYAEAQERTPIGNVELWKHPYAPKNYEPGALRAAWTLTFNSETSAIVENALPYAQRVEYGWSKQAPNGMLRLTVLDFPKICKAATESLL